MTHASLFSGIGGSELAASWLGWQNAFCCEINEFCCRVLEYHFKDTKIYHDIKRTDFTPWRGRIDVLTGGFPCQPFSLAGKRLGTDDDRYLWPEMRRAIEEIRPTWVIAENVKGIYSMAAPTDDDDVEGEVSIVEKMWEDLERLDYSAQPFIIPACAVGAPHRRDRVYILARRNGGHCGERPADIPSSYSTYGQSSRRSAADTDCDGPHGSVHAGEVEPGKATAYHACAPEPVGLAERRRWEGFPNVAPLVRGNDGLPFDVGSLAISANQWRIESIRAVGNAIVPQVMYELFLHIEAVEMYYHMLPTENIRTRVK